MYLKKMKTPTTDIYRQLLTSLAAFILLMALAFLPQAHAFAGEEKKETEQNKPNDGVKDSATLILMVGSTHAVLFCDTIRNLNMNSDIPVDIKVYNDQDVKQKRMDKKSFETADIVLVDGMHRSMKTFASSNIDFEKTKAYDLRGRPDKEIKIKIDPKISAYFQYISKKNIENLVKYILNRDVGIKLTYEEPFILPPSGMFHPKSNTIITDRDQYLKWYKAAGLYKEKGLWIGLTEHSAKVVPSEMSAISKALILKMEKEGFNVLPVYSTPFHMAIEEHFLDKNKKALVDMIVPLSFDHGQGDSKQITKVLQNLDVPVIKPMRIYSLLKDWEASDRGLTPLDISRQIAATEVTGFIEPTILGGRQVVKDPQGWEIGTREQVLKSQVDFFVARLAAWQRLRTLPNSEKKIAIFYYNNPPGKQNVGASYLNIFASLENIFKTLQENGYTFDRDLPGQDEIKELVIKGGINIGAYAPGELVGLLGNNQHIIRIPMSEYLEWYKELDPKFCKKVEKSWGPPQSFDIMVKDNHIILPCIVMGNVLMMPQPARGWGSKPEKLYHSTSLYPHHQYIAAYLWLKKKFKADALVNLGRHGTHEWLPGKQTGLSQSCPPEVLGQDLPNIYPYIVDGIGEGLQAKRRGRAVIISHLTPVFTKSGLFEEYQALDELIGEYQKAKAIDSSVTQKRAQRILDMVKTLGLDQELSLPNDMSGNMDSNMSLISDYLMEIKEKNIPYGLHTFGKAPEGRELEEFVSLINERHSDLPASKIRADLEKTSQELDSLVHALNGGFIAPGGGRDPIRDLSALPTGRNFFGFDPARVPSKEAFILGKQQAQQMVENYKTEHGKFPEKIGLILWSSEVQVNEGTQVATALYLMGMSPVWDKNEKVTGVTHIPGNLLNRPRIDVHLQISGLFRDAFPNLIMLLDDAVQQAALLDDAQNFIALHSQAIKGYLETKGYDKKSADILSRQRLFSASPGNYGTRVGDLASSSGVWEKSEELADVYINTVSFAYGRNFWGKPLKSVYKKGLETIDITMHTRSSNLYQTLDNDDVFQYLGGLSAAVKKESGQSPDVVISHQENPDKAYVESLSKSIGREMRSRTLNPKWIKGQKKEKYSGAGEMADQVENIWGWQATVDSSISEAQWQQVYEVYVNDKYKLGLKEFFDKNNPWARQSITGRLLETARKEYWKMEDETKNTLAREYAMDVVQKGVACCEHTCNNPAMNQMVVNIISMPGVMPAKEIENFKAAISKALGKTLEEAVKDRKELQESIGKKLEQIQKEEKVSKVDNDSKKTVKGYEIKEEKKEQEDSSEMGSSGMAWAVMGFVLLFLIILFAGWKKGGYQTS